MLKKILSVLLVIISLSSFGQNLYPIKKKDLWGYKNYDGKMIIKAQYESALEFEPYFDLAPVQLNGKWGMIDKNNTMVIPNIFDQFIYQGGGYKPYVFSDRGNEGTAILNGNKIKIDLTGKQIIPFIEKFEGEEYAVCYAERDYVFQRGQGKRGLVNKNKELIIPTEYEYLQFSGSEFPITAMKEKDGKFGYINLQNEVVIPFEYESCTGFHLPDSTFTEPVAKVKMDGVWFYINKEGENLGLVDEVQLNKMKEFSERSDEEFEEWKKEFEFQNEERLKVEEVETENASSSSSGSVTSIFHCGFCATTKIAMKMPNDNNCPSPGESNTAGDHHWKKLGLSGNTTYTCRECNLSIQTEDKTPLYFNNCSGHRDSSGNPGGHSWTKH